MPTFHLVLYYFISHGYETEVVMVSSHGYETEVGDEVPGVVVWPW